MANEFNHAADAAQNLTNAVTALAERTTVLEKPEVADKPNFLKDVANGLVNVAKTIWHVPAAQGYIATLIVRLGVPGTIAAVLIPIIDALVK